MGEKGAVVSKQQLSDELIDGFRACEKTPEVEETAVCSETDVDAVWQVLFCLKNMMLKKVENNVWARTHSCLTPSEKGKLPDRDTIVFHLTLLTFMELAEVGEKFWGIAKANQDFPQCITADSIKGLCQVYESCI